MEECLQHLLLDCDHARSVWLAMNVNVSNIQLQNTNLIAWIISWFRYPQHDESDQNSLWTLRLMCTA